MKLVIEIKENPKENDLIMFVNGKWTYMNKSSFLDETKDTITELTNELNSTKEELEEFKGLVNNKLKDYHDILQLLTKGEEE